MCGILAVIGTQDTEFVKTLSQRQSHRGPDENGIHLHEQGEGVVLSHERLSIVDLNTGTQPIQGTDSAWVMHNGEIYNHNELRNNELKSHTFRTTCDSEVIVHLYEEYGYDFCNMLKGVFAFVVVDGDKIIAGRDPIGVKPMYFGKDAEGRIYISSEMKVICDQCESFEQFPPGHYWTPETGFVKYYSPVWEDHTVITEPIDYTKLHDALVESTRRRLMADVPVGVLLSGGLDSSLIAAVTKRMADQTGQELHSFSVGIDPTAPDLVAAKKVADFIGTTHHEIIFSVEEGLKAIEKVIWYTETYDVTTVRASTPMYFLSKYIQEMGVKVVMSGEGADEIFGGYLYFHNAPSHEEFAKETVRRVGLLATADCLRADKSTMANGVEARVPFLDRDFLDVAMMIRPEDKAPNKAEGKMEKFILRKAFENKENPYLPEEILWRQKEQFGDGVGYSWIDGVIAYAKEQISDEEFATAAELFPHNTPETKEAFLFRKIFVKHYPEEGSAKTVLKWIPKWQKNTDPSGRVADVHDKKVEDIQG